MLFFSLLKECKIQIIGHQKGFSDQNCLFDEFAAISSQLRDFQR